MLNARNVRFFVDCHLENTLIQVVSGQIIVNEPL
jgi:hypothetical protein